MNKLQVLIDNVNNLNLEFIELQKPVINLNNGTFKFNNGGVYGVGEDAATTMRNLTGSIEYPKEGDNKHKLVYGVSHSEVKEAIESKNWVLLEQVFNMGFGKKDTLVASVVNGNIVGVYSNYNGVHHQTLLDEIKESGLGDKLRFSNLTNSEMSVYLYVSGENDEDEEVRVSLALYNNINSFKGLGYYMSVYSGKLELKVEFESDKHKHLSNVGLALTSLQDNIEYISNLNVRKTLKNISPSQFLEVFYTLLDNDNKSVMLRERIENEIFSHKLENALDIIQFMGTISEQRGFKTVCREVGQKYLDKVFVS